MLTNFDGPHLSNFFALISKLSYHPNLRDKEISKHGFIVRPIDNSEAETFILESENDLIIVCRGTEVKELSDITADIKTWPKRSRVGKGLVHDGFQDYAQKVWPEIVRAIKGLNKKLWFTGHSLGGAMVSIMAIYCRIDEALPDPYALYTYGSPRIGNKRFVLQCDFLHERWVNNIDIVANLPPLIFGYRHFGQKMYFDYDGKRRELTLIQTLKDRVYGLLMGLKSGKINYFVDHSIEKYSQNLTRSSSEKPTCDDVVQK